eukprot:TRINITY_DN10901_c0_g1_i1.p1 TRINITY_DN10901_c0_g1~~TRINITY_DN10901_c0_g1_i1.p1  ORF type:complete len:448 (-),score=41.43 TRINITY_DN10901_c0_g1_i1:328-1671(-)
MYTSTIALNGSNGNRDSVSRDQLLHARRRRRIKSMTSAPVTDVPLSGIVRSPSDVTPPSNEEQKTLNTVPRQIKASHRTRSISLNEASRYSPELLTSTSASTENSPSSSGELIPPKMPDERDPGLSEALKSRMRLMPEVIAESIQVEMLQNGKTEQDLPKILLKLSESNKNPIPLLSRKDRKRNLRSYSLPPKIPPSELNQTHSSDVPQLQNHQNITETTDPTNIHPHSLPHFHTLPKAFNLREVTATHSTVWTEADTINDCKSRTSSNTKSARRRRESRAEATGDWKLDVEEDEIRNLPIDSSEIIELHQRCLAPDPISMLVGDYPLDRAMKTLKFSSTISTSTMIIKPSTTHTPSTNTAILPGTSKLYEASQVPPLRFVSFSRLPPAGLPSIPGISLVPLLQIPDSLTGLPINSPRTPPDRSRYNVNIISPRSAFSPHTPHSSPR